LSNTQGAKGKIRLDAMIMHAEHELMPWERQLNSGNAVGQTDRNESMIRLWAGFAASAVIALTVTSFMTGEPNNPSMATLVTPAQANITAAAVTPEQVDMRISTLLGTLENRLAVLETQSSLTPLRFESDAQDSWTAIPEMHVTLAPAENRERTSSRGEEALPNDAQPDSKPIQMPSRLVKTYSVNSMPLETFPLPLEKPLP
jgi:hypothetical protein